MADQFVPTAWDNAKVTEGVFVSRTAKGGYYYTRLEWHKWNGDTYVIKNELYRAKDLRTMGSAQDSQDILGIYYPLSEVYPELEPKVTINGLNKSLFEYWHGIEYEGQTIESLAADGYEIAVNLEDAVLEDSSTKMNKGLKLMTNGVLSKKTFLTDTRFGVGMTDDEADQELKRIADEGSMTAKAFDLFESGAIE